MTTNTNKPLQAFTKSRDTAPAFWSEDILWIMLATGQETAGRFSLMEQLCAEGSGPPSHLHMEQDETFYLVDGTADFDVNGRKFAAAPGDFVSIPRWTPHSFRVTSPACRMVNSYFPAGFEQVILASGTPATARSLPPRGLPPTDREQGIRLAHLYGMAALGERPPVSAPNGPKPIFAPANTGPAYWEVGILWTMLGVFEQTGGSYSYMEELLPNGPAAPPHRHEAADEIFYILDGEATFFAGEPQTALKATAGSIVFIPRQTVHGFQIDSPTAKLLNAYTPAGFEHTIPPVAIQATARTLPPSDLPPTDMAKGAEVISEASQAYPGALTTVLATDFLNRRSSGKDRKR